MLGTKNSSVHPELSERGQKISLSCLLILITACLHGSSPCQSLLEMVQNSSLEGTAPGCSPQLCCLPAQDMCCQLGLDTPGNAFFNPAPVRFARDVLR